MSNYSSVYLQGSNHPALKRDRKLRKAHSASRKTTFDLRENSHSSPTLNKSSWLALRDSKGFSHLLAIAYQLLIGSKIEDPHNHKNMQKLLV